MNFYHWKIQNGRICAFVKSANIYSPIATIHNERAIKQLIAYSQLGEDIEHVVDMLVSEHVTSEQAAIKMVQLVQETIKKTS